MSHSQTSRPRIHLFGSCLCFYIKVIDKFYIHSLLKFHLPCTAIWHWRKNRHLEQWNKTESPNINPCIHGHLIFDKPAKNAQWRKDCLINKWSCENWLFTLRMMKLDSTYISHSSTVLAISIIRNGIFNCINHAVYEILNLIILYLKIWTLLPTTPQSP